MSHSWSEDRTEGSRSTVRDVLVDAERRLQRAGVPSPAVDAAELVAFTLGVSRSRLLLLDTVSDDDKVRIEQLLTRRLSRVPLQHLLGTAPFRYLILDVGPGVFIPRPETELVVEAAVRHLNGISDHTPIAVDLCSGSGAIAIAMATECPGVQVHAIEWDDEAIHWTRRNVEAHRDQIDSAGSSVTVHAADATAVTATGGALVDLIGHVDVVVTNPPYIPDDMVPREPEVKDHEPAPALYGGPDGLVVVRGVARSAADLLRPGGLLVVEHADVQGEEAGDLGVPGVLSQMGDDGTVFVEIADRRDLNGLPRFTMARRSGVS